MSSSSDWAGNNTRRIRRIEGPDRVPRKVAKARLGMNYRTNYSGIRYGAAAAVLASVLAVGGMRAAQNRAAVPKASTDPAKTPRTSDGHPDFSGFYNLVDIYRGD